MVETNRLEPEQRKRSNSLPSPSIPFSFESNELTKVEKDFIEVPEIKDVNVLAGKYFISSILSKTYFLINLYLFNYIYYYLNQNISQGRLRHHLIRRKRVILVELVKN